MKCILLTWPQNGRAFEVREVELADGEEGEREETGVVLSLGEGGTRDEGVSEGGRPPLMFLE
jgi:hypothetical protein